jgi:radical SAM superfamily enzyme YgiQ (UPF0313 family)
MSLMDSRHFWRVVPWFRVAGIAPLSVDRAEGDPIVIAGGQAVTAPAPIEPFIDVVYVGEAEAHLIELVSAIERGRAAGWSRSRILEACAAVPGCLVPTHRPVGHVVHQVYADDISITLQKRLWVNHRKIHRVEIARGCRSMCGFCALGWRSRYRENAGQDIADALTATREMGVREVHLSAGDAEGHSAIDMLRGEVERLGLRDYGWTGRVDTIKDCSVSAGKQFAFGLEGLSHRLRRGVGKAQLTDDYIADKIETYWAAGGRRLMVHLIGGLPTETDEDAAQFASLLSRLEMATGDRRQHLEIGRQPFGPLPHTPMQWFAPGLRTDRIGRITARYVSGGRLAVVDKSGQNYASALVNAVVMRGGVEVQPLIAAGRPRIPAEPRRAVVAWRSWLGRAGLNPTRYTSEWEPGSPLPWDHIRSAFSPEALERAHTKIVRRLS